MRVLALTRYASSGSSSRYRCLQYIPHLQQIGFTFDVSPLLDERYLGGNRKRGVFGLAKRMATLVHHGAIDVVWLQQDALPWVPWMIERVGWRRLPPVVVDLDDNWFYPYETARPAALRRLMSGKLGAVCSRAAAVVVGNTHLAELVEPYARGRVHLVPTVVDLDRYPWPAPGAPDANGAGRAVVGWIGSPTTALYLPVLAEAIDALGRDVEWRAVGATVLGSGLERMRGVAWDEEREVEELWGFSVGVAPVDDQPWERGKCGLKILQYFAAGRPAVASPVGVNAEIVVPGVNGALARSPAEWTNALRRFLSDPDAASEAGKAGRQLVERCFSLAGHIDPMAAILRGA